MGKRLTHEEVLALIADRKLWRRAHKTKPILVRVLQDAEIGRDFTTADHTIEKGQSGFVLCVGVAGEPWFQTPAKVDGKYTTTGETETHQFDFDTEPQEYQVWHPKPGVNNWVAQIPAIEGVEGFTIRPKYDMEHPLYSPTGGFVVKDDVPDPYEGNPNDVWLVQRALFESTYQVEG